MISWGGNCRSCGKKAVEENIEAIATFSGPQFLAYRRAMVAAFGGVLLDDLPASTHTHDDAA